MAIVIGSDDIYGVSNQNILSNNRIDGISYQDKVVSVSEEGSTDTTLATVTEADNGNAFTDNNSDFKVSVGTTTTNYTNKIYTWTRIETYYSTFSFPVSRSYGLLKGKNLTFNSTVQAIENESPTQNRNTSLNVLSTSVSLFPSISSFGSDIQTSTTTGLLADGVASLSFNPSGIAGEASVKQSMTTTISIGGYDDSSMSNYYKVTVRYPTKVSGTYGTRTVTYTDESIISQYVYYADFAQITSIDVYLSYSDVGVSDSGNLVKLGTFDSTSNTFSLETNSLIQETTTYNDQSIASYNASQELSDWQNGRESVDIDVMVGEFYNEDGNPAISTEDESLPMTFNIGDLVMPYTIDESGNEVGLSTYSGGDPLIYDVYGVQVYYDGACWQKLNLIESALVRHITVSGTGATVTITRTASPTAGASLGVVTSGVVYIDDVITIDIALDDDYSVGYYLVYSVDGQTFTLGDSMTVTDNISIIAAAEAYEKYTLTSTSSYTVTRTASPAGAATGTLSSGATLYAGDSITISTTKDVRTAAITMGGTTQYSVSALEGGFSYTIDEVSGAVVCTLTAMAWRYVYYKPDAGTFSFTYTLNSSLQYWFSDTLFCSIGWRGYTNNGLSTLAVNPKGYNPSVFTGSGESEDRVFVLSVTFYDLYYHRTVTVPLVDAYAIDPDSSSSELNSMGLLTGFYSISDVDNWGTFVNASIQSRSSTDLTMNYGGPNTGILPQTQLLIANSSDGETITIQVISDYRTRKEVDDSGNIQEYDDSVYISSFSITYVRVREYS